ncbi:MAG: hypothetical protein GXO42_01520 [bacterium]|nr:hypothetical protein [bacterium]
MVRKRVILLGKEKALYEWILGFFVIITGIIVLCSLIVIAGKELLPLPELARNVLITLDLLIGGILLAIWGEQATLNPVKSVAAGFSLLVFGILLLVFFGVPGIVLGTVIVSIGVYLIAHGILELSCSKQ